ncbi:MAG: ATP-dependent zinc metalloprotease FtsH [Lachnospiraceae bacterium]|jgi:cell division protease FtsH|nr:ATP-dependent zinc metalloprotease FtsH [Lachnospiraceae bacterium]
MENKGNNNNNGGNNNGGNNKNGMTIMIFILTALLVLFLTSLLNSCAKDATNKEITYSEFIDMVEKDKVESVTFTSSRINITPKGENKLYRITYYTAELNDESLIPLLKEHDVKFGGTVEDVSTMIMWNMLSYILPLVLVWVLLYFLIFRKMGSGGMMGVGKTTAKVYVEKSTGVTFRDVAGQDEAKESLQEVVDFLHNPRKYTDIGAKLPKGALLVGPPGTGKTLLAKAVAGEAKVPFFSLAGSDFVEMFVGVGASRVRDLFKEAQKQAPCIIFIDEIDAIGKSRDTRYGGNDEREQTLNQLLAEMDGFDTSKGLLILAATNRPEVLDKALLRPGRFDRRIIVDKPDLKGRVETLKVHAKNVLLDDSVDLDAIALATSGAVGSDLANMINEAAINAVKQGRKYVNQSDLFESVEVVIAGKEKKDRIMGPKEKKMVAYHEVGHALVTALQKDAEPVQKITIVPRTMGALGYTMQVPEEEKFLMTKNELVAHLVTYMGGRAAEEIVFDSVTTGASNDIEQATKIARAMVTQYGMSEKFGLMGLVTIESQYLDGRASLNCGEETAGQIDLEVMRILKESYDEATRLLLENREILDKISQQLYENETITGKEFMKIFRELKGIPEPEEKTEAEKAAESFQAEQEHVKQQAPTVEMQEHMKQQAPTVEIQEEEILVNTLREEDLPPELSGKEEASPEHQELEVNTLEGEEARPRQEQKVELIPVTVNMPNLQKPEAPGQMEASETMKEEAKPAVPEAKEEARPVSLEASTPEELGFFPVKKGSGKKGKSIPAKKEASVPKQQPAEEALREKQSVKGQTSSSKPEPEKTEQEAEEDYLDQLLKELK